MLPGNEVDRIESNRTLNLEFVSDERKIDQLYHYVVKLPSHPTLCQRSEKKRVVRVSWKTSHYCEEQQELYLCCTCHCSL